MELDIIHGTVMMIILSRPYGGSKDLPLQESDLEWKKGSCNCLNDVWIEENETN